MNALAQEQTLEEVISDLLKRASFLVGNPATNISSSTDIACENWQKDFEALSGKILSSSGIWLTKNDIDKMALEEYPIKISEKDGKDLNYYYRKAFADGLTKRSFSPPLDVEPMKDKWISIEERLPEINKRVLLRYKDTAWCEGRLTGISEEVIKKDNQFYNKKNLHWVTGNNVYYTTDSTQVIDHLPDSPIITHWLDPMPTNN